MKPSMLRPKQQGAALAVSLIFLILLTLLSVAGMQSTIMEEKMSGNMRDRSLAFQASESALLNAERDISANISIASPFLANCTGGLCTPSTTATPVWENPALVNWTTSTNTIAYGANVAATSLGPAGYIAAAPEYIIEIMPEPPKTSGQTLGLGKGSSLPVEIFRVTARGVGGSANAPVMVQSVFKK